MHNWRRYPSSKWGKWPKNAVLNLALCCGAIWSQREKPQHRCTTKVHPVYNCSKKISENLLPSTRSFCLCGSPATFYFDPRVTRQTSTTTAFSRSSCYQMQSSVRLLILSHRRSDIVLSFSITHQHAMHAERGTVMANLSLCLSVQCQYFV